jgi:hypothetical protein
LDKFNSESKIKAETKVNQDIRNADNRNRSSSMENSSMSNSIHSNANLAIHNPDKMDPNKMDSACSMDSAIDKLLNFDQNDSTYIDNDMNINKNYYPDNNPTRIAGFTKTNNMNYYNPNNNYNNMMTQDSSNNVNIPSIPYIASNSYGNDYATSMMKNNQTGMNNNNLNIDNNLENRTNNTGDIYTCIYIYIYKYIDICLYIYSYVNVHPYIHIYIQ